ncbi:PDZ domain-containing protein [Peribacillus sp. SCS-26]|uniref:PDZ domain-containing protein n=1 Tax=Paraperibacillus marinus TaxID=3115295 RepID=UPI003906CE4B
MAQEWITEFLSGAGKLLLHPLFYISFLFALLIGDLRIKRERRDFNTRVEDMYLELRHVPAGLVMGLILSVLAIAAGLTVPAALLVIIALLSILACAVFKLKLLSPAFTVGLSFFILFLINGRDIPVPLFEEAFQSLNEAVYPSAAVLLGLLLTVEGLLIGRDGPIKTSPKLIKSRRGALVGAHVSRRLWLVPLFLFIPGGSLEPPFSWWPVFTLGDSTFTPVLVPFLIGFSQRVQGFLPKESIKLNGRRTAFLGVIVLLLAAAGWFYEELAIAAAGLAVLGRMMLHFLQKQSEERRPFYFSRQDQGLMILGIIPGSPAARMGLEVGEIVTKVNGVKALNEQQFYEALQRNGAHCKLEVLNTNGQIRFVQRALYEGEHHELGILFVQEQKKREAAG